MNVLFLHATMGVGGAERVISALANDFIIRGDKVSIVVLDNLPSGYYLNENVSLIKLNIASNSKTLMQRIKSLFRQLHSCHRAIRTVMPDVVVALDARLAVLSSIASIGLSTKVIGSECSNPYVTKRGTKEELFVRLSALADGFVFITQQTRDYYPASLRKRCVIIPNGIFCKIPQTVSSFKDRPSHSICATGRLVEVKRHDLLINAFEKMDRAVPGYTLHIYGDGPLREELAALISAKHLTEKVILEGICTDIAAELVKHRIFVLSSDYEGMPIGLIEAMACGVVCISTDCDFGPAELISNGVNGLLTPVGDCEALATALETVASDTQKADSLSREACKIQECLSQQKITDAYHNYLHAVVNAELGR